MSLVYISTLFIWFPNKKNEKNNLVTRPYAAISGRQ